MHQIIIRVTDEEQLQIKNNAKAAGRTMAAYIRETALNYFIFDSDPSDTVNEHIREISALRNAINQIIYTVEKTGDYFPSELDAIHDLMVKIMESERSFLVMMEDENLKNRKILKSQVKAVVNERLKMLEKEKKKDS